MRILNLLFAAALAALHTLPAEAVSLGLNGGSRDPLADIRGFGHWVALDGDAVLVGSPDDGPDEPAGDAAVGRAFMFSIRDGSLLRRFDEAVVTPRHVATPGLLVDSYEVLIAPDETGDEPGRMLHIGMGTGTLTWTAHRAMPAAESPRRAVALGDGRILIGAPLDGASDPRPHEVRLYSTVTGELLRTFAAPGGGVDGFGRSVAMNGELVLIGAPGDDTNGTDVGGAYLYSARTGSLLHRFEDPTITGADRFGTSVAVNGTSIAVGAPGDDSDGAGSGQAYLFSGSSYELAHILQDPEYLSRVASRAFGHGSQYHVLGRSGGRSGAAGGGGGSGGGGGGSGSAPDGPFEYTILDPDASRPGEGMPETPTVAPLPGTLAFYLSALGIGALLFRRRRIV
ncbi:MAG TPA: FG-GAP repeat protein [Paracoccaceae bacterium]|nr:FG-GAP repeat protein [Paracoccaceae bacterium]